MLVLVFLPAGCLTGAADVRAGNFRQLAANRLKGVSSSCCDRAGSSGLTRLILAGFTKGDAEKDLDAREGFWEEPDGLLVVRSGWVAICCRVVFEGVCRALGGLGGMDGPAPMLFF